MTATAQFHLAMRTLRDAGAALDSSVYAFFVPGRIEVLGKHTDYAGGRSLLATVDRGFIAVAVRRADGRTRVIDAVSGEQAVLDDHDPATSPLWVRYPATVLRRMERNFPDAVGGADVAFASNLPPASGLSSSSALVVAIFLALGAVRGVGSTAGYAAAIESDEDLAGYLGAVENGLDFRGLTSSSGVGTMGGSEDHTAMLCAREGRLVQYSFAPVRFERAVRMPDEHVFVVASSGVRAEKAGAAMQRYNALAQQTQALVRSWHDAGLGTEPTLGAIIDSGPDAASRLRDVIGARPQHDERAALLARLVQFEAESGHIVREAADALDHGDTAAFGEHVRRSQQLAEQTLGNQIDETIFLVRSALEQGALAASAFGAGFGGSVWALTETDRAAALMQAWRSAYTGGFPAHADAAVFFSSRPAGPASRLA
ncbi:MAG: galactokinase family protein [Gemmatimonadota bacterium]